MKFKFKIALMTTLFLCLTIQTIFAAGETISNTKTLNIKQTIDIPQEYNKTIRSLSMDGTLVNDTDRIYADHYFYNITGPGSFINSDNRDNYKYQIEVSNIADNDPMLSYTSEIKTKVSFVKYNIDANRVSFNPVYTNDIKYYLNPSENIESDNERIIQKSNEIVENEKNPYLKAKKIYNFTYQYLDYDTMNGNYSALNALNTKLGVCEDYSRLMVALLRAQGIPARTVSGYRVDSNLSNIALDSGQYNHMWVEFYINNYGWIPADPTIVFNGRKYETDIFFAQLSKYYYIPLTIDDSIKVSYSYYQKLNSNKALSINVNTVAKLTNFTDDSISQTEQINKGLKIFINSSIASYDGKNIKLDAPPILNKGRTLVPLRFISDYLKADIDWNNKTNQIKVKYNNTTASLIINSKIAYVNGEKIILDTTPIIHNGRTMVPLKFISEILKVNIEWNNKEQSILIRK